MSKRGQWRPSNWKNQNPYKDHWGNEMTLREDYETNQHYAFEQGADAMLETLKKVGVYDNKDALFVGNNKKEGLQIKHSPRGWLVFIPDNGES